MSTSKVSALALSGSFAIALAACSALDMGEDGVIGDPSAAADDDILSEHPGSRNPVVIVHGCPAPPATDADDLMLTDPLRDYFIARGYPAGSVIQYLNEGAVCDSTLTQADQLGELVVELSDASHTKVDLIAHSMGSLTARLVAARYPNRVDDLISIAGANHGTEFGATGTAGQALFGAPAYEGAKEMFPAYACQGQTLDAADVQFTLNGCLGLLGRTVWRDETPGTVDYLTIRNLLDEIIEPFTSTCLNQKRMNDCSDQVVNKQVVVLAGLCPDGTPCLAHQTVLWNPGVMETVFQFASAGD